MTSLLYEALQLMHFCYNLTFTAKIAGTLGLFTAPSPSPRSAQMLLLKHHFRGSFVIIVKKTWGHLLTPAEVNLNAGCKP